MNRVLEGQLRLLLLNPFLTLLLHLLLVRPVINAELLYLGHEEAEKLSFNKEDARRFEAELQSTSYLFQLLEIGPG